MTQGSSITRGEMIFRRCTKLHAEVVEVIEDAYGACDTEWLDDVLTDFVRSVVHDIMKVPNDTIEAWAMDEMR